MKSKEAAHLDAMYVAIESYESDEDDIYGKSHMLLFEVKSNYSYIGRKNYNMSFKHKTTIKGAKTTPISAIDIICNGNSYQSRKIMMPHLARWILRVQIALKMNWRIIL